MELFEKLHKDAEEKWRTADYLAGTAYNNLQDPKLLLTALENVFLAFSYALSAVVHYERLWKRVPPFTDDFEGRMMIMQRYVQHRYDVDSEYLKSLREVKLLVLEHKKSPIEFRRKDQFVICTDDYQLKVLTQSVVRGYVGKCKDFLSMVRTIINKEKMANHD
jgi:hypothetical protein